MKQKEENHISPIERKLAAVEWNLKLLKTSAQITHTPLRTLKNIVQASVVVPTHNFLREVINSQTPQRERLAKVWHPMS